MVVEEIAAPKKQAVSHSAPPPQPVKVKRSTFLSHLYAFFTHNFVFQCILLHFYALTLCMYIDDISSVLESPASWVKMKWAALYFLKTKILGTQFGDIMLIRSMVSELWMGQNAKMQF